MKIKRNTISRSKYNKYRKEFYRQRSDPKLIFFEVIANLL